jgi:hypothetical protein
MSLEFTSFEIENRKLDSIYRDMVQVLRKNGFSPLQGVAVMEVVKNLIAKNHDVQIEKQFSAFAPAGEHPFGPPGTSPVGEA